MASFSTIISMKRNTYVAALLLLVAGFLASCNKDKEVAPSSQQDFESAKSTLEIISEVNNLNDMVMSFSLGGNRGGRRAAIKETECGVISYQMDYETGDGTITADYGSGTQCDDGMLKGKVIFTVNSSNEGALVEMSAQFVGFEKDGKKLDGTYQILVTSNESDNSINYTYTFKNGMLTYQDGTMVKWNSTYELKLKFDYQSQSDVPVVSFEMTGGIAGTDRKGKTFSADITSPLVIASSCNAITKGKYLLKAQGHADAIYDFGNGECDQTATLTINGQTEKLTIK